MFKVAIVAGYAEKTIEKCICSLLQQTCEDWEAQVFVDPVGDNTFKNAANYSSTKLRITLNEKRQFALSNLVRAFKVLCPEEDDVLVTIDGDDWLYSQYVFEILKKYYTSKKDLLLTYGSWVGYPDPLCVTNNFEYTIKDFCFNIRKVQWRGTQLRTFKYKVWKHVKDIDLRDCNGEYYRSAWDLAMMWPMFEMSGYSRVKFIPHTLYVNNQDGVHHDNKDRLREQMQFTDYIASRPQYLYREDF